MKPSADIHIIKSDGSRVPFSRKKLLKALQNSGADQQQASRIVRKVEQQIFDGISTRKIYQLAYSLLRKKSHRSAGRYKLKKAIFELGPSGYPFELFVGRLFETFGYKVETGVQLQGKCINHEVDVLARRPGMIVIAECKFHSDYKAKTNVQVPLYIHSRFKDVEARWKEQNPDSTDKFSGYVVTNTRFTIDAMRYAECENLGMISWDYPEGKGLKYFIDQSGLHPVTSLHSLTKAEKRILLDKGIVLCSELLKNKQILTDTGIDEKKVNRAINEASSLISV